MIELAEAALLLRGWADSRRAVRIVFRGKDCDLRVSGCRVFGVEADSVAFMGDGGITFEFFLRGCVAEFRDSPEDDGIESGIVFRRPKFALFVMLLATPQ